MRGAVRSDVRWIHIIWIIKATYFDIYHTFVRFTLKIANTKAGLSDCIYDQMIVLVYCCSDGVILVLSGKGETSDRNEICTTHHTNMFIISLSLIPFLW